jgi:hypothetical protein
MTPITLDVPLSTGQISGSVTPGERRFDVVVNTNIGVTFTGSTTVTLVPGPNGGISIQLAVNAPPKAKMRVSNAFPKVGEAVTVSVAVTDPDVSDTHTFTWNGGGGSISGSGPSATWVGNLPGKYTVSVTVDDGHGGVATQSVVISIINQLAGLFVDPKLAACVAAAFPTATTTAQVVGYLECAFKNISDLSGMEKLTGLTSINLFGNLITNVTPLGSIKAVVLLDLGSNAILDVTPLTTLPALTLLAVDGNQITDAQVAQLATITKLTWLHLRGNLVTNIAPLANLTNLTDLWLGANTVTNLAPLAGLTGLVQLELYGNNISDVAPLAGLTALTYLALRNNQIVDVSPLATLTGLTYLDMPFNNITTGVSSLSTLTAAKIYLVGNIGMSCLELNILICGSGNTVVGGACIPYSTGLGANVEISGNGIGNIDMPTNGSNCTNP